MCGWSSYRRNTAATSTVWTRFPTKSCAPGRPRHHRPVAHRPVGAKRRLADHQATARPHRCGGVGLLAEDYDIAQDLGGNSPTSTCATAPPARRPAGQRHGAEPHGHRFQLGDRASRTGSSPAGKARFPSTASRPRSLHRRPRRDQDRRPLLRSDRCRRGLPPPPPADGATRYVYHGNDGTSFAWNDTAQLDYSKAARARAGDPDHPARRAAVSDHSFRCRDGAGETACSAPVVSACPAPAALFLRAPRTRCRRKSSTR